MKISTAHLHRQEWYFILIFCGIFSLAGAWVPTADASTTPAVKTATKAMTGTTAAGSTAVTTSTSGDAVAGPPGALGFVEAPAKIKYKSGKELDFEQLVIDGQLKRPDMMVVTGDNEENTNGLLRLRENFIDHMAESAGKDIP